VGRVSGVNSALSLNGHDLTISGNLEGGGNYFTINGPGRILSSSGQLSLIGSDAWWGAGEVLRDKGLIINAVISDSNRPTNISISKGRMDVGVVHLRGSESNTFMGNVYVSERAFLTLGKTNGAVAVQGNIDIRGGRLIFYESNQLSGKSKIQMNNGHIEFNSRNKEITQKISSLKVSSNCFVYFDSYHGGASGMAHENRYLYLDNIVFDNNGYLGFRYWEEGRDFILINKKNIDIDQKLGRFRIYSGARPNGVGSIHLEDFNEEYWYISAAPEPATCGAVLGVVGLAVVLQRRRGKRYFVTSQTGPRL